MLTQINQVKVTGASASALHPSHGASVDFSGLHQQHRAKVKKDQDPDKKSPSPAKKTERTEAQPQQLAIQLSSPAQPQQSQDSKQATTPAATEKGKRMQLNSACQPKPQPLPVVVKEHSFGLSNLPQQQPVKDTPGQLKNSRPKTWSQALQQQASHLPGKAGKLSQRNGILTNEPHQGASVTQKGPPQSLLPEHLHFGQISRDENPGAQPQPLQSVLALNHSQQTQGARALLQPQQTPVATSLHHSLNLEHSGWEQMLQQQLNWQLKNNQHKATLRLDPPQLGELQIQIQLTNQHTQVQLVTSSHQAQNSLQQQLHQLHYELAQQTHGSVRVDVSTQQQSGQQQPGQQLPPAQPQREWHTPTRAAPHETQIAARLHEQLLDTLG
ncbi:flagellar hook-length control protein FliK [Dongshaea marina]|uniref:flagellar hook-length control protein FliK n=1 Tax=Dongshaea marina TaxID=2047966 RepID=UPI00131F404B|nr:flagellar hook-length control protein FliK [Dongshaea marina]